MKIYYYAAKRIFIVFFVILLSISSFSQNFEWAKRFGGTSGGSTGLSIAEDNSGNVYTTGNFGFTVDFDPGINVYNLCKLP